MSTTNDWSRFFDAHAPVYMKNCFTRNTTAEVGFLMQHLSLHTGMRVLDVGCGTGRHSVELARRGLKVTGLDISSGMLREAYHAAERSGVTCRFIQADAATWRPDETYDAAICLCEGAFCLLGQEDDPVQRDLTILRNIAEALRPAARFMLTTLSAARLIRSHDQPGFEGSFDLRSLVQTSTIEETAGGSPVRVTTRERVYVATELELMFRLAGFTVTHIGGGTAGNWSLRPIDPDEFELMVLAHR